MNKKIDKISMAGIILLLVTAATVFAVNLRIPFMMDDLWYSTLLYSPERIDSFSDIISAQVWHYNNWGGRSITHGLLQLILMCGESAADVLNTLFIFILSGSMLLTASVASGKTKNLPASLSACAGMIIGLNANWKMSMFWEAGAANYLFITVFIMLFLFCYLREVPEKENADHKSLPGICIWMIPLAIIAGWSNENMGPTCFIISVATMILIKRAGKKISLWMIEGSILSLAGSVMCIVAPGNFVRNSQIPRKGFLWTIFLRCYTECTAALSFQILTVTVLAAILLISTIFCGIKLKNTEKLLLLASLLSWGAMFLSPHYPDRATFGTMCLMITVIMSRASLTVKQKKEALGPLFLGSMIIWVKGMYDLTEFLAICFGWIT